MSIFIFSYLSWVLYIFEKETDFLELYFKHSCLVNLIDILIIYIKFIIKI
jgi:hypothetical protein